MPITFGSTGLPELDFNFLIDRMSFDEIPLFPGDGGPYELRDKLIFIALNKV